MLVKEFEEIPVETMNSQYTYSDKDIATVEDIIKYLLDNKLYKTINNQYIGVPDWVPTNRYDYVKYGQAISIPSGELLSLDTLTDLVDKISAVIVSDIHKGFGDKSLSIRMNKGRLGNVTVEAGPENTIVYVTLRVQEG